MDAVGKAGQSEDFPTVSTRRQYSGEDGECACCFELLKQGQLKYHQIKTPLRWRRRGGKTGMAEWKAEKIYQCDCKNTDGEKKKERRLSRV